MRKIAITDWTLAVFGPASCPEIHALRSINSYSEECKYVAKGTLTEEHLVSTDQCLSEEFTQGSAFVESPGQVHSVKNTGNNVAVIWWATVFPQSDGLVEFAPGFKAGGVYPVPAPNCN